MGIWPSFDAEWATLLVLDQGLEAQPLGACDNVGQRQFGFCSITPTLAPFSKNMASPFGFWKTTPTWHQASPRKQGPYYNCTTKCLVLQLLYVCTIKCAATEVPVCCHWSVSWYEWRAWCNPAIYARTNRRVHSLFQLLILSKSREKQLKNSYQ